MNNAVEGNRGVHPARAVRPYKEELDDALRWGFVIGVFQFCSQVVGFCNLAWATVALLGALLPYLLPPDFTSVMILLFLEAARLSTVSFFAKLVRHALAVLSQNPKRTRGSKDEHYLRAELARFSALTLQLILTIPGATLSAIRLASDVDHYNSSPDHPRNVQKSLRIFYSSVFFNCCVVLVTLACTFKALLAFRRRFPQEQSIRRYFDEALENTMSFGIVQAHNFEFLRSAYAMLASEFIRDVQIEAVAKNYAQLLQHLYSHQRLGVNLVQVNLNAEDVFLQLVAANMVGFWAHGTWGVGVDKLRLPRDLLTRLADKVEQLGQVGWAASVSFGALALSSPKGVEAVESTCTSRGVRLLDRMADLIDSSGDSISLVRTLVYVYEKSSTLPTIYNQRDFQIKLRNVAREAIRHRLRVQSAYLLHLMHQHQPSSPASTGSCDATIVLGIEPTKDDYWHYSEKRMLKALHRCIRSESFAGIDFPHDMHDDCNDIAPDVDPATTTTQLPNRQDSETF